MLNDEDCVHTEITALIQDRPTAVVATAPNESTQKRRIRFSRKINRTSD